MNPWFLHHKVVVVKHASIISEREGIHYGSLSAMFTPLYSNTNLLLAILNLLHSSTNQELFEKHLCNQGSHYEKIQTISLTQRKPSRATTLYTVSKDEWNTKEKSLKNALGVLQYAKRHLSGWSDVEQWKNQAGSLSHYWVYVGLKASGS